MTSRHGQHKLRATDHLRYNGQQNDRSGLNDNQDDEQIYIMINNVSVVSMTCQEIPVQTLLVIPHTYMIYMFYPVCWVWQYS